MVHRLIWVLLLGFLSVAPLFGAEPTNSQVLLGKPPIVVIIADKMDSTDLFQSRRPAIQRLLAESGCGLMNIRSGSGYTNSNSGYLTLGSGDRVVAPGRLNGAYAYGHLFGRISAADFWGWSMAESLAIDQFNLVVPEIGWIYNQAEMADRLTFPGLLGSTFRMNGWQTVLIGNVDTVARSSRPGGLLLMDRQGIIEDGRIDLEINAYDPNFPYGYHFSVAKTMVEVEKYLAPRNLLVIEFGDFARLDQAREQIPPERFNGLTEKAWERFDHLIDEMLGRAAVTEFNLLVLTPSLARESWSARRWLAPLVIHGAGFPSGLLTSMTTRWTGLTANLDILPTLSAMADLRVNQGVSGRRIISRPVPGHLEQLVALNSRINMSVNRQRLLLDAYLTLIVVGWGLMILFRQGKWFRIARGMIFSVMLAPLILILLPMLPPISWQVTVFWGLSMILGMLLGWKGANSGEWAGRIGLLLWLFLTLDQVSGWQLIRFSALGYSPASGSRYYGMGNEYMGIYLAVSLFLAHFIREKTAFNLWAILILAFSIFILAWPHYGINFGGTLAAIGGFFFYEINLYGINLRQRKLWYLLGAGIGLSIIFGIWDALREPELQTHVGSFFRLIFNHDLAQIGMVIFRKLNMNFKLLLFSAWTRIILLALVIGVGIHFGSPVKISNASKKLAWRSVLVAGIVAVCVNDSGVVALGTCLAYGFSDYLLNWLRESEVVLSPIKNEMGLD